VGVVKKPIMKFLELTADIFAKGNQAKVQASARAHEPLEIRIERPASRLRTECEIDQDTTLLSHAPRERQVPYFRCFDTSLVISNMFTVALPPNTTFSAVSALIILLFLRSCSLFFLM
jgi:hypothetical protein